MASVPRVNQLNGTDVFSYANADGTNICARFDQFGRRRVGTTPAPSVALGAAAGTGSPSATVTGTDEAGVINITAGTSPTTGTLVTLTFNQAFATAPVVHVTPQDANGAAADYWVASTTAHFVVSAATAIGGNTKISYTLTGGA